MAKRNEADQKIWDAGWRAHNAGIDSEKCPFVPRSAARRLWMNGWRAAAINADQGRQSSNEEALRLTPHSGTAHTLGEDETWVN